MQMGPGVRVVDAGSKELDGWESWQEKWRRCRARAMT
jgi:hypothetical protein